MFEILALLCLGEICQERILPHTVPMTKTICQQNLNNTVDTWLEKHKGYIKKQSRCEAIEKLKDRAAKVSKISPGQYVHHGTVGPFGRSTNGDIANTGFIIGKESIAVIDSGSTRAIAENLYLAIRSVSDLPIRYNILTHMHPDHTLGAEVFREAGATIIGAPKLKEALVARNASYMANIKRILGMKAIHGTQALLPDRANKQGELIDLGDRVLRLQFYPNAHTTNDLTILDLKTSTIWMGDLVFLEHTPAIDGSILGWTKVLAELDKDEAKIMVPGHGPVKAAFPDGAKPTLEYLKALTSQVREAIKRGESLNTAIKYVGENLRGSWKEFDGFHKRNVTHTYLDLEWE